MSDFQDAFEKGEQTKILEKDINGILHLIVPDSSSVKSMEHLMPAPLRLQSRSKFGDLDSFKAYAEKFAEEDSVIYLDEDNRRFKVIFDHHGKGKPTWGEHTSTLQLEQSHEWQRFKQYDGKKMKPKQFAEFIEDNIDYLSAKDSKGELMSSSDLFTMAQTFKINVRGEVEVDESLHQGLKKLHITNDTTLRGNSAQGNDLSFPEELSVIMRYFRNGSTYATKVFLRYRADSDGLVFFIKIPDPQGIEEDALNAFAEKVEKETNLKVLKGSFD